MNKSPVFLTLFLCATGSTLIFSMNTREWGWAAALVIMVAVVIVALSKAVFSFKGNYRLLQSASVCNIIVALWCASMAVNFFHEGAVWLGWLQVGLTLINGGVVFHQQKTLRVGIKLDQEIERWKAEHFTEEDWEISST